MNHPQQVITRARPMLSAGERVFYCRFEPEIMFSASETVSRDLLHVIFISVRTSIETCGMIHPSVLDTFEPSTTITPRYIYKDFVEIDMNDPAVWED